jgi:hypothetical protein
MTALETANAYHHLIKKHKYSVKSLVGFGLARNEGTVRRYLQLVHEPEVIQDMLKVSELGDPPAISEYHVRMSRTGNLSDEERVSVLHKAAREGLTGTQIMKVATAVDVAIDEDRKKELIDDISFSSEIHDMVSESARTKRQETKKAKPKVKPPEEEEISEELTIKDALKLCAFLKNDRIANLKGRLTAIQGILKKISLE